MTPAPAAAERPWLIVMAMMIAVEAAWWAVLHGRGLAPAPFVGTYLVLASLAAAVAVAARIALTRSRAIDWPMLGAGTLLVALGACLFLPLKVAIPREIPFWLDLPAARAEAALFGVQPWQLLERWLSWAIVPIDRIYAAWLPVQLLALFSVMAMPPGRAKARTLIAYSLGWFVMGAVAAVLLSSAGPIFVDRLYGGSEFAGLVPMLQERGAGMVLAESDAMWRSLHLAHPGIVAGVSAVPSIHVAISIWMALAARSLAPRLQPAAWAYAVVIWVGSVLLGWHYVIDGAVGLAGMLALWALASPLERLLSPSSLPAAAPPAAP